MNICNKINRIKSVALTVVKHNPYIYDLRPTIKNNLFITCEGNKDGAGAQALAIMSTILFAQDMGLTYVHTPFQYIEHNLENNPLWETEWEKFFGLGTNELALNKIQHDALNKIVLDDISKLSYKSRDVLYSVKNCHRYTNLFPNRYSHILDKLRSKYNYKLKKSYPTFYSKDSTSIAVHIRRGDITKKSIASKRYTNNSYIYNLLSKIQKILDKLSLKYSIHIYSQGKLEDFGELHNLNADFHLDESVFNTFHNLINSDILVMSKSTFSYDAALLSHGIKFYEPFLHKQLREWLEVDSNSKFSVVKFVNLLNSKLNSKG